MKLSKIAAALAVTAASLTATSAMALDVKGYSTANDAACALDFACATARGGVSDVMTVYRPDGSVFDRIFAFGNEEAGNYYFFDPTTVSVNPAFFNLAVTLRENERLSDAFGIGNLSGTMELAFVSDNLGPAVPGSIQKTPGNNPDGWILEPGVALTIEYNATQYLSATMVADGYTATFRSDVPEPASLALLGLGLVGLMAARRKA